MNGDGHSDAEVDRDAFAVQFGKYGKLTSDGCSSYHTKVVDVDVLSEFRRQMERSRIYHDIGRVPPRYLQSRNPYGDATITGRVVAAVTVIRSQFNNTL